MVFMLHFTTAPEVLFSPGRGHLMLAASGDVHRTPAALPPTHLFKCIWALSVSHPVTFSGGIYKGMLIAMWAAVAEFSRFSTQREATLQKDSI